MSKTAHGSSKAAQTQGSCRVNLRPFPPCEFPSAFLVAQHCQAAPCSFVLLAPFALQPTRTAHNSSFLSFERTDGGGWPQATALPSAAMGTAAELIRTAPSRAQFCDPEQRPILLSHDSTTCKQISNPLLPLLAVDSCCHFVSLNYKATAFSL